jgi:hypothetical protein
MRRAPRAPWLLFATLAATAAAAAPTPWQPVQGDLSAVGTFDEERGETLALFVGGVLGASTPEVASPLFALGLEVTYSTPRRPYMLSVGVGPRVGLGWARATQAERVLPDFHLYARLTPFLAASAPPGQTGALPSGPTAAGVRLGIGCTALLWSKTFLEWAYAAYGKTRGVYGETMRVLSTVLLLPVALANHAELTFELYGEGRGGPKALFTFRVGAGF